MDFNFLENSGVNCCDFPNVIETRAELQSLQPSSKYKVPHTRGLLIGLLSHPGDFVSHREPPSDSHSQFVSPIK